MTRRTLLALPIATACRHNSRPAAILIATGAASLPQMPVAFAETLGAFQAEGLAVRVEMLSSTAKTAEALMARSVDIISAPFEQVLQLTAESRSIRSIALLGTRDVRAVVALPYNRSIRTLADLRGRRLGVPGMGSGNHLFANYVLARSGIRPDEVSIAGTGMGRSAIAAIERGVVDASAVSGRDLFHLKIKYPQLVILADGSTPQGSLALFDSLVYPGSAVVARSEWLDSHPIEGRKIARGVKRALEWLHKHTPEEIRSRMPQAYLSDDEGLDLESIRVMKTTWSRDGIMPPDAPETARRTLAVTHDKVRNIDLSKTHTNDFVQEKQ